MKGILQLNGVRYDLDSRLESDGTATVEGCIDGHPNILALRRAVWADGREFVITNISGFKYWRGVTVVIPQSAEFLGEHFSCPYNSLMEVIFENGCKLKRIDKDCFSFSGLKSVRIPGQVEFIGMRCFSCCKSLTQVIFETPSSLREIGQGAFIGSAAVSVEIPEKCNVLDGALVGLRSVSVSR
jgi:hypothetical protein